MARMPDSLGQPAETMNPRRARETSVRRGAPRQGGEPRQLFLLFFYLLPLLKAKRSLSKFLPSRTTKLGQEVRSARQGEAQQAGRAQGESPRRTEKEKTLTHAVFLLPLGGHPARHGAREPEPARRLGKPAHEGRDAPSGESSEPPFSSLGCGRNGTRRRRRRKKFAGEGEVMWYRRSQGVGGPPRPWPVGNPGLASLHFLRRPHPKRARANGAPRSPSPAPKFSPKSVPLSSAKELDSYASGRGLDLIHGFLGGHVCCKTINYVLLENIRRTLLDQIKDHPVLTMANYRSCLWEACKQEHEHNSTFSTSVFQQMVFRGMLEGVHSSRG